MSLPTARTEGQYAVAAVCLGNICRSPMAEVVLRHRLDAAGLTAAAGVEVCSAGTGGWHVGEPMDARAAATLRRAGYDPSRHRAQQWVPGGQDRFDLVLAMDEQNLTDLGGPGERVMLFRDFDPEGPGDVPDPYYGGDDGFRDVLAIIERTSAELVGSLSAALTAGAVRLR